MQLDSSNKIVRAYVCGVFENVKGVEIPFCIQSSLSDTYGGSSVLRNKVYAKNNAILWWLYESNCAASGSTFTCTLNGLRARNTDSITVTTAANDGTTTTGKCDAKYTGEILCTTS